MEPLYQVLLTTGQMALLRLALRDHREFPHPLKGESYAAAVERVDRLDVVIAEAEAAAAALEVRP